MFRCEDDPDGITRLLACDGELEVAGAAEIREHAERALEDGIRQLILDLTGTTYVDTNAIAALVDATAQMARQGAFLTLVLPSESRLRVILSLTHVDRMVLVAESRAEALRAA